MGHWTITTHVILLIATIEASSQTTGIAKCAAGIPGVPGIPGLHGRTGISGKKGDAGLPGTVGPKGVKGTKGDQGKIGPQGKGSKGDLGPVGPMGPPGREGNTGGIGRKGEKGMQGLKGQPGAINPVTMTDQCLRSLEGGLRYNVQMLTMEYCNGVSWLAVPSMLSTTFPSSCKTIATIYGSAVPNGAYWIKPSQDYPAFQAYCDTSDGWTLIAKLNGNRQTFAYNSNLWINKETLNTNSLAVDDEEAKFASYWTLPFTQLRLGMKIEGNTRWITVNYTASSLYSVIEDGRYRRTNAGRSTWRSLVPDSSLQAYCNAEGFNFKVNRGSVLTAAVRLGLVANDKTTCNSPASIIGFGCRYGSRTNTVVGNHASRYGWPDNGGKDIKAIGYIMAR